MSAEADVTIDDLMTRNRALENDLDLAKGEAHFLRIKLNNLGVCCGDCDNCKDRPCN